MVHPTKMKNYAAPDLKSQPPEGKGRRRLAGAPHRESRAVSATCEYSDTSQQDPNLNDISSKP